MNSTETQNIASWDGFAPDFRNRAIISTDDIHYGLCLPGEKELCILPDVDRKSVLDVGCGGGENCIALAKLGAHVVGLEPAHSFFQVAEKNTVDQPNVVVFNEPWGGDNSKRHGPFHLVMFVGSSEYLALEKEFFHLINQNTFVGSFVILARIHPFWSTLFLHECGSINIRDYFAEGRTDRIEYGHNRHVMQRFHYSLEYITSEFDAAGWHLDRILEPKPVPASRAPFHMEECYQDEMLMQRLSSVPMHLLLRFRREIGD